MTRLIVAFLLLSGGFTLAAERTASPTLAIQPQILVNGSACLFTLQLNGQPEKVTAKWLGNDLTFSPGARGKWYALAGVPYETKPGSYDLAIDAVQHDGRSVNTVHPVAVHAAR